MVRERLVGYECGPDGDRRLARGGRRSRSGAAGGRLPQHDSARLSELLRLSRVAAGRRRPESVWQGNRLCADDSSGRATRRGGAQRRDRPAALGHPRVTDGGWCAAGRDAVWPQYIDARGDRAERAPALVDAFSVRSPSLSTNRSMGAASLGMSRLYYTYQPREGLALVVGRDDLPRAWDCRARTRFTAR
jgi:hypothetical protein